jgi:hypothetical protein
MTETIDKPFTENRYPKTDAIPSFHCKRIDDQDYLYCRDVSLAPIGKGRLSAFPPNRQDWFSLTAREDLTLSFGRESNAVFQIKDDNSTFVQALNPALVYADTCLRMAMMDGCIRLAQAATKGEATRPINFDTEFRMLPPSGEILGRPIPIVHEEVELTDRAASILTEMLASPEVPGGRPVGVRRLMPPTESK